MALEASPFLTRGYYDLNFLAFGTFSPLNTRSAPTFLPLLGHPYFGPNKLQELPKRRISAQKQTNIFRALFIRVIFYG